MDFSKNYYEILQVNNTSTIEEIRISYRKLSKIWHPDISKMPNSKEFFKEIVEAHESLSDSTKKEKYDKESIWGKDWSENNIFSEFNFSDQAKEFDSFKETIDRTKNDRIHIIYVLDKFKESIEIERLLLCNYCDGSGKDMKSLADCIVCKGDGKNSKGDDCFMCEGAGKIESMDCDMCNNTGTAYGNTCRLCKGQGKISLAACKHCNSEGRMKVRETVNIKLEDFIDNQLIIKMRGHASKLNVGIMGDLCVKIKN